VVADNVTLEPLVLQLVGSLFSAAEREGLSRQTPLLGHPDFDSMAAASLLTGLEEQLGVVLDDGLDPAAFDTIGSLIDHLQDQLA
jgi:acyl carrier protein